MAKHYKKESEFQADLRKELKDKFNGCIVTKTDSGDIQGIPDLLVLYKERWAALECKLDDDSNVQPNQPYYVKTMNEMSFARFVNPSNKEEVIHELEVHFN